MEVALVVLSLAVLAMLLAVVFGVPYILGRTMKMVSQAMESASTAISEANKSAVATITAPPTVQAAAQLPSQHMDAWQEPVYEADLSDPTDGYLPDPVHLRADAIMEKWADGGGGNPFGIEGLTLDYTRVPDQRSI